jgi:3,4-dihydroxy-9,10-secoandrosta-1,3,5(10)-triene-9,17-dione 4,5-dioxygenase
MTHIYGLGYIGFTAPDLAAWEEFGTQVLGMSVSQHPTGDAPLQLRMDDHRWRIAVHEGERGFAYVGWEVAGSARLDALVADLAAHGVPTEERPDLAQARHAARVVTGQDPAGNPLEFFCGAERPREPFVSPTGARFVTGDLGIGHVVITMDDLEAAKEFYLGILGFRVSDIIGRTHFTRVNARHHSFAFGQIDGPSRFRHFSLEVENMDMVGRALDAASLTPQTPVANGLGRHTNDLMLSFYVKTPSWHEVEFGCDGRLVDEKTWNPGSYTSTSLWGHKRTIPVDAGPDLD